MSPRRPLQAVAVVSGMLILAGALLLFGPGLAGGGMSVSADNRPDTWMHMWGFWRSRYALSGGDAGYLVSHAITYPGIIREPLAVFDPLLPLLSVPLQYLLPTMPAVFNLLGLLGVLLTGWAGYKLGTVFTARPSAALAAGVIAAFNPFIYRQISAGFLEYAWWGLIPLTVWLYLRAVRSTRPGAAVIYAVSLIALLLMSIYAAACFFGIAAAGFALELWRRLRRRENRLVSVCRVQGTALLLLLPLLVFWFWQLAFLQFRGMPWGKAFSTDILLSTSPVPPAPLLPSAEPATAGRQAHLQFEEIPWELGCWVDIPSASRPLPPESPVRLAEPVEFYLARPEDEFTGDPLASLPAINWAGLVVFRTIGGSIDLYDLVSPASQPGAHGPGFRIRGVDLREWECESPDRNELIFAREWMLVIIVCALAWLDRRRRAGTLRWAALGLAFLVLGMGPHIIWRGRVFDGVMLPYAWLYRWMPGFSRLNIPGRAFLGTILSLSVLAVRGVSSSGRLIGEKFRAGKTAVIWWDFGISLTIFATFAALGSGRLTLPLTPGDIPPGYEVIAREPGDFAVLELPIRAANDLRLYAQCFHGRPIFRALPATYMAEDRGAEPVYSNDLVRILERDNPLTAPRFPEPEDISDLADLGFRFLIIHASGYPHPVGRAAARAIAARVLGEAVYSDEAMAVYRFPGPGK